MPMNAQYRGPIEMPGVIPVFPLPGALLLPRGQMPLNIFEPRYIAMIDDSLRDGHRLVGMSGVTEVLCYGTAVTVEPLEHGTDDTAARA